MSSKITCDCTQYNTRSKHFKNATEVCTRNAVWIVRLNGKEYNACAQHKGIGVLVRKIV